jgi:hypothetical protein
LPTLIEDQELSDKTYFIVVVRLLVDPRGKVLHGEVVDLTGEVVRFKELKLLPQIITNCLAHHFPGESPVS